MRKPESTSTEAACIQDSPTLDAGAFSGTLRKKLSADPDLVGICLRELHATDEQIVAALDVLDFAERARAQRFVFDRDRRRYVLSHLALRQLLGQVCGVSPAALVFNAEALGRLRVVEPTGAPDFNMSHAGELAAIALSLHGRVGIDVEIIHADTAANLSARVLTPAERHRLARLPFDDRPAQFFRWWTAKEAFLKLNGVGLSVSPNTVWVDETDSYAECTDASLRFNRARLTSVEVGPGRVCTLATSKPRRVLDVSAWGR